jgi:hypothetical protein
MSEGWLAGSTYNRNTIIVDVCSLVQFLFDFSVFPLRPASFVVVSMAGPKMEAGCSLDTAGMKSGLVHVVGNHGDDGRGQGGGVEFGSTLLEYLLARKIPGQRSWRKTPRRWGLEPLIPPSISQLFGRGMSALQARSSSINPVTAAPDSRDWFGFQSRDVPGHRSPVSLRRRGRSRAMTS